MSLSITKQICNNIVRGIPFKVNRIGLFQYEPYININYSKDTNTSLILKSFSNISIDLYKKGKNFTYYPPLKIIDGKCHSKKYVWSFKELEVNFYYDAEPFDIENKIDLNYIPCIKLDEKSSISCEEEQELVKDSFDKNFVYSEFEAVSIIN